MQDILSIPIRDPEMPNYETLIPDPSEENNVSKPLEKVEFTEVTKFEFDG